LNVQVMEILDAARESTRSGRKQELRWTPGGHPAFALTIKQVPEGEKFAPDRKRNWTPARHCVSDAAVSGTVHWKQRSKWSGRRDL